MSEIRELQRLALDDFGARLRTVEGTAWDAPTPWRGATVREVVNHVVAAQLWVPPLLAGASAAELGARFDGDMLGERPLRAWDGAGRAAYVAFGTLASMCRTVVLPDGSAPAGEYLWQLVADLAVHSWDVARALGAAGAPDPLVAVAVHDRYRDRMPRATAPAMAGEFSVSRIGPSARPSADPAARLTALFGRDPAWRPHDAR